MSGGVGFSRDAMNRSRQNRKQIQNIKQSHFKKSKSLYSNKNRIEKEDVDPELIKKIGLKIRNENKKSFRRTVLIFGLTILILIILLII